MYRNLFVMQHKGEILEKAVRESGFAITKLCKRLGKTPRWMYYTFQNPDVSLDYILKIGAIIHHDFSVDIKELSNYKKSTPANNFLEPEPIYQVAETAEFWKNKYLALLEKYNAMLLAQQKLKPKKVAH